MKGKVMAQIKITIEKIEEIEKKQNKWTVTGQESKIPDNGSNNSIRDFGKVPGEDLVPIACNIYGYVDVVVSSTRETKIFEQMIEDVNFDLGAVIAAINHFSNDL
jgi:hypothetical protein